MEPKLHLWYRKIIASLLAKLLTVLLFGGAATPGTSTTATHISTSHKACVESTEPALPTN
jgi:hypothetical protein